MVFDESGKALEVIKDYEIAGIGLFFEHVDSDWGSNRPQRTSPQSLNGYAQKETYF